jgi:outer membrane receptor protein involved in Fe transport
MNALRTIGAALALAAAAMIQAPAGAQPAPLPSPSPSPSATPGQIGRTISRTATAANQSVTAQSSLDTANAVQTRGSAALENYVYDVPGLVYFHSGKSNLDHFKIRGADNEPRTEIDGHPITNTGAGNFLVGWMNAYAFDRIDVEKGPGISEGDEGRTAFGTINLITRGFTTTSQFDSVFGFDSQYGSTVSMVARGPAGRLQYVLADNYTGMGDPNHNASGLFFGPARTNLVSNAAVPLYSGSLAGSIGLRNEIAKLRYAFSPVTSLDVGYIGFSGVAAPLGSSYAGYEGNFLTGASPTATITGTNGTVQPFYSGYTNGSERVNEPAFEAAFRTQIGTGTLAISPFTMQLSDLLAYAAPPAALSGFPNSKFTGDSQHGTTVSFTQPFSLGYVKLNYEYRSDATTVFTGTTFTPATLTTPTTTLHENDLSLTSQVNLTSRLSLGAGLFYDGYHNDGWVQPASSLAAGISSTNVPFSRMTVVSNHLDPHLGIVFRSGDATWLRAVFGSSVYGPGSTLISGRSTYTAPAASNNNQGLITTVNPNLKPEVTVAYGLGIDRRFHDGTLLSLDVYDDTIHNKFLSFTATGSPIVLNNATVTPLANQTINASLQRTYGAELSAHRTRPIGFGYDLALAIARQYYDQIPPAYFIYAGGPVSPFNGYNGTSYPYWTAHAEFRYAWPKFAVAFGEDTAGADNVQRAPGFTTMYAAGQIPVGKTSAFQLSVANLFNYQTSAFTYGTGPTGSGASTITAYPAGGVIGAPLTHSQQLVNVQGVAPRAYRFSFITHLGAHS